jgi:Holliday junction resolvase-like predicted endonuclease
MNGAVDRVAWAEIIAAANAYLSATMRSEQIHYQVRPMPRKARHRQRQEGRPGAAQRPQLSGEIDVVAGMPEQRTVWLLEVKDPADTYVLPKIRRHLDTFFADRGSKPC